MLADDVGLAVGRLDKVRDNTFEFGGLGIPSFLKMPPCPSVPAKSPPRHLSTGYITYRPWALAELTQRRLFVNMVRLIVMD